MTAFLIAVAIGLPAAAGTLLWQRFWPMTSRRRCRSLLLLSLGAGWGIGASSCTFFLWRFLIGRPGLYAAVDGTLWAVGVFILLRIRRHAPPQPLPSAPADSGWRGTTGILAAGFGLLLMVMLITSWINYRHDPHGGWDAVAIWNARARFLARAEEDWRSTFNPITSHVDYPLLVPASVARGWSYARAETTALPATIAAAFALGTVGVLVFSVAGLRSWSQALIAGLLLLGNRDFLKEAPSQMADIPVGYFMLAATVVFCWHDRWGNGRGELPLLAGSLAGLAAWTKNEGWLFMVALVVVRLVLHERAGGWRNRLREMGAFLAGLIPVLVVVALFKVFLVPSNELVAAQGWGPTLQKLRDSWRWTVVAQGYAGFLLRIGPGMIVLLGVYWLLVGSRPQGRAEALGPAALLVLMLGGYFLIHLTTPRNPVEHIANSLDRLLLQLWPLAVLTFALIVATPEEARGRRRQPPQDSSSAQTPNEAWSADRCPV